MNLFQKTNKYLFYISLILNAILLKFLFGLLPLMLYLSVVFNFGLIWYIRQFLKKNMELEDDVNDLMNKIDIFSEHIESIHSLEMYYGDENLKNLIDDSRVLVNDFVDFQVKYYDVEEDFDTDEKNEEETTQKEE